MKRDEFLTTLAAVLEVARSALDDRYTLAYANWDSLTTMSTIAAIDQHFDISVNPKELFACGSIKDLLALIRAKGGDI